METLKDKKIECYFDKSESMYVQNNIDYNKINLELMVQSKNALTNLENNFASLVGSESRIPLYSHQVFFTNIDAPKKPDAASQSITLATLKELNRALENINSTYKSNYKWVHHIWTNSEEAVPDEFKAIDNLKIMIASQYNDHPLWKNIEKAIEEKLFAQASDLMRYVVLDKMGGIYRDLDNKIFDHRGEHVIKLMFVATLLAGKETETDFAYMGNSLIAAVSGHPSIKKVIESSLINLDQEHPEKIVEYIKYACTQHFKIVYQTGPVALTMAILETANQEGYNDLVMPRLVFYNSQYVRSITPESRCYKANMQASISGTSEGMSITSDSGDLWCGGWYFQTNATEIIDYGPNISSQKYQEYNFFQAVYVNNIEGIINYINQGGNVDALSTNGVTALFIAVVNNLPVIVDILLKKGANPNLTAKDGNSPLFLAIINDSPLMVKMLLASKAEPNIQNSKAIFPLGLAALKGNKEIINLLLEAKADRNNLFGNSEAGKAYLNFIKPEILALISENKNDNKAVECHFGRSKEMFVQEGIDFDNIHKNNLLNSLKHLSIIDKMKIAKGKIPQTTHQIYFFGDKEEASLDPVSVRTTIETLNDLNDADDSWFHYIWTDNEKAIPAEIKNIANVEIKSINGLNSQNLWPILEKTLEQAKIERGLYAQASDILRYMVLYIYGGIYRDFDYKIYNVKNLRKLMGVSNLLVGKEEYNDFSIGNSFIAVSPKHQVINMVGQLVGRNLGEDQDKIPNYVKFACLRADKILYQTGPVALTIAFYKSGNINDNVDLLMPREIFYNREYLKANSPDSKCYLPNNNATLTVNFGSIKAETIGADPFCSSWNGDYLINIIDYGDNVSSANFRNARIFHSILSGRVDILKYDLKYFSSPDIKNSLGVTPLFVAAILGKKEMVELLLEEGANPNFISDSGVAIDKALQGKGFKDIESLIANARQVGFKADNKKIDCYFGRSLKMFEQEGINYSELDQNLITQGLEVIANIEQYQNENYKIPLISHQIYFTSSEKPNPIDALSLKLTIESIKELNNSGNWIHYFWTNSLNSVPSEIKNLKNVEVRTLEEFIQDELWNELNDILNKAENEPGLYSPASDILRYILLASYGGIYRDLDYRIYNAQQLTKLMSYANTIVGKEDHEEVTYIGSAFIACSKDSLVCKTAKDFIKRNLNQKDPLLLPEYIKYPCTKLDEIMYRLGPSVITMAFYKSANINDSIDIMLPSEALYNTDYLHAQVPESRCYQPNINATLVNYINNTKVDTIGSDMFCGSWALGNGYCSIIINYGSKISSVKFRETKIATAAQENDLLSLDYYYDKSTYIDSTIKDDVSPLYLAVKQNNIAAAHSLLLKGANPNFKDKNELSILRLAKQVNNPEMIKLLEKFGGSDLKGRINPYVKNLDFMRYYSQSDLNSAIISEDYDKIKALLKDVKFDQYNLYYDTPLMKAADKGANSSIYSLVFNRYWDFLENYNANIASKINSNESFEVVVVRYKEDLSWIEKEFGSDVKVTIYNKGDDDLDYLPYGYKIIKTDNIGYLGGTYLLHIVNNYQALADRVFFSQGWPYDTAVFLPLSKYKNIDVSTCFNIVGKCQFSNLETENQHFINYKWEGDKYHNFANQTGTMKEFFYGLIDKENYVGPNILADYGAIFSVSKDDIQLNPREYYQEMLPSFAKIFPLEDHFLERSWNHMFQKRAKFYVVNLDQSQDRLTKVSAELNKAGVNFERFSAINGDNILINDIDNNRTFLGKDLQDSYLTQRFSNYKITCNPESNNSFSFNFIDKSYHVKGELGLWCSNLLIWQDALDKNYQNIIILEDDVQPLSLKFKAEIDLFLTALPYDYDVAFLDFAPRKGNLNPLPGNPYVLEPSSNFIGWGTSAVMISNQGLRKLVSYGNYSKAIDLFYWDKFKNNNLDVTENSEQFLNIYTYKNHRLMTVNPQGSIIQGINDTTNTHEQFKAQFYGDFNSKNAQENLFLAAAKGDANTVKALVTQGVEIDTKVKLGITPLMAAIFGGHQEIVKILLENGANPNFTNKDGISLLRYVIDQKKTSLLKLLLDANVDLSNKYNNLSIRQYAEQINFKEGAALIAIAQENLLIASITNNDLEGLKLKLDKALINQKLTVNNKTLLYFAAISNKANIVSWLVENGADVNIDNPIYFSARFGFSKITKILTDAGADLDQYFMQETPIHSAVASARKEDVDILLAGNATIIADTLQNPLYLSAFLQNISRDSKYIYNQMINHYWNWLAQNRDKYIISESDRSFEVVIVRFNEDLSWIEKEFPTDMNIKITIYNKGENDLDYLPASYNIVNIDNVGWFGGTILRHIAFQYDQLADRTLYLQGNPYEQGIYLPMLRYMGEINSICTNILAKCEPGILLDQSNKLQNYKPEQWAASKYHMFTPLNYTMIDFFHKWVDTDFPEERSFMMDIGAQFAVDVEKVKSRPREHYQEMLPYFDERYATADFCFEKAIDPLFGPNVFNYTLEYVAPLRLTQQSLDNLLIEALDSKNYKAMKNLLAAGANAKRIIQLDSKSGYNLLNLAQSKDDLEAMEILIDAGSDIDFLNSMGMTPLMLAVSKGEIKFVKLLVNKGANINQKYNGHTLLDIALKENNHEIIGFLKSRNSYDMVYVISLESAVARKAKLLPQLEYARINYKLQKAIDGNKIQYLNVQSQALFPAHELKNKASKSLSNDIHSIICNSNEANSTSFLYLGKLLDKTGKYGQICSHLIVMKDAQEKGYNNIVILADDVSINLHEANSYINAFISHLPDSYDIGYLDYILRKGKEVSILGNSYFKTLSDNFFAWGSHAAIYSKNAIDKLLKLPFFIGDLDTIVWGMAKNNNLNNTNSLSTLEIYKATRNDIIELQPGYSFINNMEVSFNLKDLPKNSNNDLEISVRNGNLDHVKYLIAIGNNPYVVMKDGSTLLHLAAENGNVSLIDYLLKEGLDPEIKNIYGANSLAVATVNGNMEAVRLLKELKVDKDITFQGLSLYEIAKNQNNTLMSALISMDNMPSNSNYYNVLLIHAAEKGKLDQVKYYLDLGADINFNIKVTPLLAATVNNHPDVVEYLLEENADPDVLYPLYFSAMYGNSKITKLLLDYGANPNAKAKDGDLSLRQAVNNGNYEDVKLLVEAGAEIQSDNMHTPLFEASYYRDRNKAGVAIFDLLIDRYWKLLDKKLKEMEPFDTNRSFEVVIARYKEDLKWIFKEFDTNTNITIYNKGPNNLDHLKFNCSFYQSSFDDQTRITSYDLISNETENNNCKVISVPNVGWFGGTILYHMYNRYDSLADRTFFSQGFPYDQELYLPIVRYKGNLTSGCKNFVAKCLNSTLIHQSEVIRNTPDEIWAKSRYPNFIPPKNTMVEYCREIINPDLRVDKPLYINLGAQAAIDKENIQYHSKEYYGNLFFRDYNITYATMDFFLEKCWDPFFQDPKLDYYDNDHFYLA